MKGFPISMRWVAALTVAAAMVAFPVAASADSTSASTTHLGPYPTAGDPDGGSCGAPWALDNFDRFFQVQATANGTFTVREEYKNGSFLTTGPLSPGACELGDHHGAVLAAGISGTLTGYLVGSVSGGSFNPAGCSAAVADCTTTAGFISAVFGASALFTTTEFAFQYASGDPSLIYHHWTDSSGPNDTEIFIGDIATG